MSESPKAEIITVDKPHLKIESLGYKGVDLTFMGVNHSIITHEAFRDKFEEKIKTSDAILLEGAPRAEGLIDEKGQLTEETIKAYQQVYKMPVDQIKARLERSRGTVDFFARIEDAAARNGKDILIFDTFSMDPHGISSRQQLQLLSYELAGKTAILTALGGSAATVGGFLAGKDILQTKSSRRRAITGIAAVLAAGMTGGLLLRNPLETNRIQTTESIDKPNALTFSLADFIDYRNAAIARTFTSLADAGTLDKRVTAIYGDSHRAQVKYYLEHPTLRDLKLSSVYQSMAEAAPPSYRRFSHQKGVWNKTVDQKIKL